MGITYIKTQCCYYSICKIYVHCVRKIDWLPLVTFSWVVFVGEGVRGEKKMNFLWVEDFPLFLPREDGLPGGSIHYLISLEICYEEVVSFDHLCL